MFRANDQHLQVGMFDTLQQLPEKVRQRLESSWGGTFYREFFCRMDELPFAVLYSDEPSRPNVPINILVAAEILKAGFGWSDEQLYEEIQFNLQVRYALGLWDISVVPFTMRTLYHFRQRLSKHMQETGENLLDQVFVQVTDEQLKSLKLNTEEQRMDSVLVSSNIRHFSRLHLLVEVVQRVWRMLTEEDQAYYTLLFEPYRRG
ncbi:MAG: transposase, partial [Anaerolineae bacterium]